MKNFGKKCWIKIWITKMYKNINKCSTIAVLGASTASASASEAPVLRHYSDGNVMECWHSTGHQYWSSTCSRYCASTAPVLEISTEWRYHVRCLIMPSTVYSTAPVLFSTASTGTVPRLLWISTKGVKS